MPTATNTSPRTTRPCRDALAAGALALAAACSHASAPKLPLNCSLTGPAQVRSGQPAAFRLQLMNSSSQPVQVLVWNTPFEPAWFGEYVTVQRGSKPLPYGGAKMKRGDPSAGDYLRIEAGATASASFDLAPVFDLSLPGRYRLHPQIVLHDVVMGTADSAPRPRSRHVQQALRCKDLSFDVLP